jgi:hypothetical protein
MTAPKSRWPLWEDVVLALAAILGAVLALWWWRTS